jgi:hypothetical protein
MNKKYWELTPQTEITTNDILTFAKEDGSNYITSYITLEDFLQAISNDVNVNLGPVLDNTISTPPSNPSEGDRYIIPTGSTGSWSSNINDIAQWNDLNDEWQFYEPISGDRTIVTTGTNAGKVYEFNGTTWTEVIVPVVNSTPFVLAGTSIDAGSNKTSRIARTGDVVVGATNTGLTGKHVVFGSSLSSTYVTRNAYAPTTDITRTGKWYRVMSFDCNYSIYASHHYKFMLAFNGNSDGAGFVAEMDVLIKRQNNAIYLTCTIKQTVNGTELVYVVDDKNIEFLWNNTNKRVTMYFRPDLNYSSLSFTILTPRESTNRFNFLNQYTNATDLSGEVNDVFTEKYVVIGETVGHFGGALFEKTNIVDQTNGDKTFVNQNQYSLFSLATDGLNQSQTLRSQNSSNIALQVNDNVGNISTQETIEAASSFKGVADSTNLTSTQIIQNTTSISTQVDDSNNALVNISTQSIGSSQETITDINSGEYVDVFRDTISYQIRVEDANNSIGSSLRQTTGGFEITVEDSIATSSSNVNFTSAFNTINSTDGTNNSFIYNDPSSVNMSVQNNVDGITTTNTLGLSGIETVGQNSIDNIYSAILMDVTNTSSNELRLNHKIDKDGSELTLKSTDTQLSVIDDTNGLSNVSYFSSTVSQNLITNDNTSQVTTINTTVTSHNINVDFDGTSQLASGLAITNDGTDLLSGLFTVDAANSRTNNIGVTGDNVRIASIDSLNSQESYISVYSNIIELFNNLTTSQFSIGEDISIVSGSSKIYLNQLPVYADDAAADADVNLGSGALYKLTGSRAVYQKP